MKKLIYIMVSAAMLAGASACNKETTETPEAKDEYTTLHFTPEYDLDVEVKSVEIGKTDIWCFFYDYTNEEWKGPFKQSEINESTYSYQVPKTSAAVVHFVIMPEELLDYMNLENYSWIDIDKSLITLDKLNIYMTDSNEYHETHGSVGQWVTDLDQEDVSLNLTMGQRHRKSQLMVRFTNLPESVRTEDIVKEMHPGFGNLPLDKGIKLSDMRIEKRYDTWEGETTWYCADIYSIEGRTDRYSSNDYYYFTLTIETKDQKIYQTNDLYLYFNHNEEIRITIDYNQMTNNK